MNRRKLTAFNFISLNGYFEGPKKGDIGWHKHDVEENAYSEEMVKAGNILLFGRVTYEMMASFWPSPFAIENYPVVAAGMNNAEKIVFSKTMEKADWNNTGIVRENIVDEVKKLKLQPGKDMTILGSGSILTQFAEEGIIDEYQIMLDPVAIGSGTPLFKDMKRQLNLQLTTSKVLKSGVVILHYRPSEQIY